jgi:hypothetical protein
VRTWNCTRGHFRKTACTLLGGRAVACMTMSCLMVAGDSEVYAPVFPGLHSSPVHQIMQWLPVIEDLIAVVHNVHKDSDSTTYR